MSKKITEKINNSADIKADVFEALKEVLNVSSNEEVNNALQNLRNEARSVDAKTSNRAMKQIEQITGDIILKVFTQEIYAAKILPENNLLSNFNDGYLNYGNTKEYTQQLLTGASSYTEPNTPNDYVPTGLSKIPVETQHISFYKPDGQTLNDNSFKWRKEIAYIQTNLIQYFLSGKTSEFISKFITSAAQSLTILLYDKIYTALTTTKGGKQITLKGNNVIECWEEVFDIFNDMSTQICKDYNFDQTTQYPTSSNPEDIIVFANHKVLQKLKTSKAFVYNSGNLEPLKGVIENQALISGRKYVIGDENTIITTTNDSYVDDKTIILFDKKSLIKIIYMLNENVSQFWAKNLVESKYIHLWFTWAFFRWGRIAVIKSDNLLKDA